jgi:general secretion pathway protein K
MSKISMTPHRATFEPPPKETGAALLTVLLLVAVMAVIAATALDRLQISTRLAANGAAMAQARYYIYAAELIAVRRIDDLLARDAAQTTLSGDWLNRDIPVPIDNGLASARLTDADNCFNLNLVTEIKGTGGQTFAANRIGIEQFTQLMVFLQVNENEGAAIAQSAADWIDSDMNALPGGAEDTFYRSLATPYLPPNRMMVDRSELRAVKGVKPQIYNQIQDWICTLPQARPTALNVNTMSPDQAPLLAMLFAGKLSPREAKAYLASRPADGYGSAVRFFAVPLLAQKNVPETVKQQVQLKSAWFKLNIRIQSGGIEMESNALINASAFPANIVSRSFGEAG